MQFCIWGKWRWVDPWLLHPFTLTSLVALHEGRWWWTKQWRWGGSKEEEEEGMYELFAADCTMIDSSVDWTVYRGERTGWDNQHTDREVSVWGCCLPQGFMLSKCCDRKAHPLDTPASTFLEFWSGKCMHPKFGLNLITIIPLITASQGWRCHNWMPTSHENVRRKLSKLWWCKYPLAPPQC